MNANQWIIKSINQSSFIYTAFYPDEALNIHLRCRFTLEITEDILHGMNSNYQNYYKQKEISSTVFCNISVQKTKYNFSQVFIISK